jgi:hypothetical protein
MSRARDLADQANGTVEDSLGNVRSGRRNLIINGDMRIAQRGTSFTPATTATVYTIDRFEYACNLLGTYTITQESDSPSGLSKSLKIDTLTADASPAAGDYAFLRTMFEGQDFQHLDYGSTGAKSLTLSFWVKSNKTGTGQVDLINTNAGSMISGSYTINSAATWEYKTITFVGNTTQALLDSNAVGVEVEWWLDSGTDFDSGTIPTVWESKDNTDRNAAGTLNIGDNTANYWQITGVQLEVGTQATDFEHRSYGEELALCQRYYETGKFSFKTAGTLSAATASAIGGMAYFKATKRVPPTGAYTSTTEDNVDTLTFLNTVDGIEFNGRVLTGNRGRWIGTWTADAEL